LDEGLCSISHDEHQELSVLRVDEANKEIIVLVTDHQEDECQPADTPSPDPGQQA
jgi:ABC-type transport system involved in cytochrome c biogenesis ATPase subunit